MMILTWESNHLMWNTQGNSIYHNSYYCRKFNSVFFFLSTDGCTDIYRGVNIIANCVSAAWHFSVLRLITTWCIGRRNHNFTGRRLRDVYDIKVTQCLLRQLFTELCVVFGLPVLCMPLGSCTHLCVYAHFFVWRAYFLCLLISIFSPAGRSSWESKIKGSPL